MGGAQPGVIPMNRRPKLSLVSNRELNKKQALNLNSDKRVGTKPSPLFETQDVGDTGNVFTNTHVGKEPSVEKSGPQCSSTKLGWPDRRFVVKAAIVAVTVALSIFLLKRRLM